MSEYEFHEHRTPEPMSYSEARAMLSEIYNFIPVKRRSLFLDEYMLWHFPELKPLPGKPELIWYDDGAGPGIGAKMTRDYEPYELDTDAFQKSLPQTMKPSLYLECESLQEVSVKLDAIIGRVYIDHDAQEVWIIGGFEHLHIEKVSEWHVVGEGPDPIPVAIYHVLIIPRYETAEYSEDFRDEPEEAE